MANFEQLFTKSSIQFSTAQTQGAEDEDWADVALPSRMHRQTSSTPPTAMPSLTELPRPEILFASQTPYHLIVKVVHDGIVVQGSHQGSLELLAGYLQRYTRDIENISIKVNHTPNLIEKILHTLTPAQVPMVKSELQASLIGYGGLFDSVTITPGDPRSGWVNINPVLILSFVESVLGYSPVTSAGSESQWYFKRDVGFKK